VDRHTQPSLPRTDAQWPGCSFFRLRNPRRLAPPSVSSCTSSAEPNHARQRRDTDRQDVFERSVEARVRTIDHQSNSRSRVIQEPLCGFSEQRAVGAAATGTLWLPSRDQQHTSKLANVGQNLQAVGLVLRTPEWLGRAGVSRGTQCCGARSARDERNTEPASRTIRVTGERSARSGLHSCPSEIAPAIASTSARPSHEHGGVLGLGAVSRAHHKQHTPAHRRSAPRDDHRQGCSSARAARVTRVKSRHTVKSFHNMRRWRVSGGLDSPPVICWGGHDSLQDMGCGGPPELSNASLSCSHRAITLLFDGADRDAEHASRCPQAQLLGLHEHIGGPSARFPESRSSSLSNIARARADFETDFRSPHYSRRPGAALELCSFERRFGRRSRRRTLRCVWCARRSRRQSPHAWPRQAVERRQARQCSFKNTLLSAISIIAIRCRCVPPSTLQRDPSASHKRSALERACRPRA